MALRKGSILGRCNLAQLQAIETLLQRIEQSRLDDTSMASMVFDQIDRKILAELQNDGRMTNVELAQRVGLTAPPCLRRVRALEDDGAINGYHAQLNPARLGYTITVFAMVSLKSQAESDLRAFEDHIAGLEAVRECHMLNGEIDFILKIVARDLQEFQAFLTTSLTTAPNVAGVKTSLTIRTSKQRPGVPVE
jgi:DNA-binding Lrp family transcriptional regulator